MPCSQLSLLITGHLAHGFGHPQYIIALAARCHNARFDRIRTKSLCELLKLLPLDFADNCQIHDSVSGLFGNAQNVLITGGNFVVVSLSCGLYKWLIIAHILSARTIISYSPIPKKGSSLYFGNRTPVHCLLDRKIYLTSFWRFLLIVLIIKWHQGVPVSSGEQGGLERLRFVSNL